MGSDGAGAVCGCCADHEIRSWVSPPKRPLQDPASRINAAVGVACLVGHEEGNPKLQLSEDLVVDMLQARAAFLCVVFLRGGSAQPPQGPCAPSLTLSLSDIRHADLFLQVLDAACVGSMKYGTFWTVWKLCQGLASLSVNDRNKVWRLSPRYGAGVAQLRIITLRIAARLTKQCAGAHHLAPGRPDPEQGAARAAPQQRDGAPVRAERAVEPGL